MGRRATLKEETVYAFVGDALAKRGTVTLQQVVAGTGYSMGSLYHRFGSREGMLASAWLDALEAFQTPFAQALEMGELEAGARAALLTPAYSRQHTPRAVLLACCRPSEMVTDATPPSLRERIDLVGRRASGALKRFAQRVDVDPLTCQMALFAAPQGIMRLFLPAQPAPLSADARINAAYWALMTGRAPP